MRDFEYYRPQRLDEAIALLVEKGEGAFPLAGGSDIIVKLKRRRLAASCLVDLKAIPDLRGIELDGSELRIGALVTHSELIGSSIIRAEVPVLARAASLMAFPEIRNRGTVGGNICNADPAADLVPSLVALKGVASVLGPDGRREVAMSDFILGRGRTALKQGEILMAVRVPRHSSATACSFARYSTRRTGGIAAASAAAFVDVDNGLCREVRIVLGALEDKPRIAAEACSFLEGKSLDDDVVRTAARMSVDGLSPIIDTRISTEYRLYRAEIAVRQALTEAWAEVNDRCATS